ncbi:MAG: hypothetical protein ACUVXF_10660, partial [Desulfobaccales bacterium]
PSRPLSQQSQNPIGALMKLRGRAMGAEFNVLIHCFLGWRGLVADIKPEARQVNGLKGGIAGKFLRDKKT